MPIGIFAAVYLTEYSKKDGNIVFILKIFSETLAGIPSIIYALFGRIFFVSKLKFGFSVASGTLTLAIMTLPLIIRTSQEALKSVSDALRENSYALGASRIRTIFKIILPVSLSGIFSAIMLSIGRILGETVVLIYTAGTSTRIPNGKNFLFMPARTLSVHMYSLSSEGVHLNETYSTALILLIVTIFINLVTNFITKKLMKNLAK